MAASGQEQCTATRSRYASYAESATVLAMSVLLLVVLLPGSHARLVGAAVLPHSDLLKIL
eukprot:5631033-Pleurochrysis_carterae.AAC.1